MFAIATFSHFTNAGLPSKHSTDESVEDISIISTDEVLMVNL
jgi:hypothetical protein